MKNMKDKWQIGTRTTHENKWTHNGREREIQATEKEKEEGTDKYEKAMAKGSNISAREEINT